MDRPIAVFLPSLDTAGGARVLLQVVGGLLRRGWPVDVVTIDSSKELQRGLPRGATVFELSASPYLRAPLRIADMFLKTGYLDGAACRLPSFVRYLRDRRPLVLLTAWASTVAAVAWRVAHVPTRLVFSIHTAMTTTWRMESFRTGFAHRLIVHIMYPWAHSIIAVSNGVANDLTLVNPRISDRIRVIYNPVVGPGFFDQAAQRPDHPWLQGGGPPVILGAGRLSPEKDFATLIGGFALARRKRPMRLILLGEGPERESLERLIGQLGLKDEISMPGHLPNPISYMSHADVFVLSSLREGFPLVLAEALATGTPVVATDCPSGPAEILDHGRFGRLVKVRDAGGLAASILETLGEETDHERLRKRGEYFSVERAIDQYLNAFGLEKAHRSGSLAGPLPL